MTQQLVQDLLRVRHSHLVRETTALREVAERLIISDCDVMAVTDERQQLIGIVCESAVVRALLSSLPEHATIQSIIVRHAESVRQDAALTTILPLFRSSAYTAIPVVDQDGCVSGLLMRRDVIAALLNRRVDDPEPSMNPPATTASIVRDPNVLQPQHVRSTLITEHQPSSGHQPNGPHFLRGEAARRLLWAAEDRL